MVETLNNFKFEIACFERVFCRKVNLKLRMGVFKNKSALLFQSDIFLKLDDCKVRKFS